MSSGAVLRVAGLQDLLDRCQRLIRIHSVLRGFAETVCVLIACVLFGCLVDYFITLSGMLRFAVLVSTITITGLVAWKRLIGPLLKKTPEDELAAAVDLQFPELQEAMATLISIGEPGASSSELGSKLMRDRLQSHVQSQMSGIHPSEMVQSSKTFKRCGLAFSSVIAFLIPVLLWPSGSQLLMQRFVMPFANLAAASNLYFEVSDGNHTVATNSDVQFVAIAHWRTGVTNALPENVVLEMQCDGRDIEEMKMTYDDAESQFSATLADVRQSLQYRVRGGGALTEWFQLTVADAPRILSAMLRATPPAYTGRPVETFDGVVGDIRVFERSAIEIVLSLDKPVRVAQLAWNDWKPIEIKSSASSQNDLSGESASDNSVGRNDEAKAPVIPPNVPETKLSEPEVFVAPTGPMTLSSDGLQATLQFEAMGSGEFKFEIVDFVGLAVKDKATRRLIAQSDMPPVLTVNGIRNGQKVKPDDTVVMDSQAIDDIGLGSLEVHFQENQQTNQVQPAASLVRGALEITDEFRLDLKTLDLKQGDTVTFRVRAADERPTPDPQVVWEGPFTIEIADDADPFVPSLLGEEDQKHLDAMRELEKQLLEDAQLADELKEKAEQEWNEDAKKQAKELAEKEQQQGRELKDLADKVAEDPKMKEEADKLADLAQQMEKEVPEKLDDAASAKSDSAAGKMKESASALSRIRADLQKAADEFEKAAKRPKSDLPNQKSSGPLDSDRHEASSDPQGEGNPAEFDGKDPKATTRKGKNRVWGKLQDELNADVGDAGKDVVDNEYSELIRRYRRDLARSGDQDAAKKPDPQK